MDIKASCTYDKEAMTALYHMNVFKNINPRKGISLLITPFVLLLFFSMVYPYLSGSGKDLHVLMVLSIFSILLLLFFFYTIPRMQYKKVGHNKTVINRYYFKDDEVIITSEIDGQSGSTHGKYSVFMQACETDRYLFLFQGKMRIFIIDKSTIKGGSVSQLKEKLCEVPDFKYIRCAY